MFSNRLKELRKKLNMTQTEFAKEFNIANGTVGNWESGNRQPDYITINKIADFFGVSIDYLLGRTDFSAEENRKLCQNVTRLWETIKNPPNPENIIGILQPLQDVIKNEYQFTYEALEQFASYFGVGVDTLTAEPVTEQKSLDTLSESDLTLLNKYKSLDEEGKTKVDEYLNILAELHQLKKHKIDGGYIVADPDADVTNEDIEELKKQ